MKEIMDQPVPAGESAEKKNFPNRKPTRPTLPRGENHGSHNSPPSQTRERAERLDRHDRDRGDRGSGMGSGAMGGGRKLTPPEQTNAENFYYQKQMQSRTPMVIVLRDGEEVHGIIEWYDRQCIKVNRENGGRTLMFTKPAIKIQTKRGENER